jgi:predicted nucleotidyltransferase
MPAQIPIDKQAIAVFCRKWRVTELGLYGSVLRDDFRPDSDIDVFVTFEGDYTPGLAIVDMSDELSALLGRPVDLGTKRAFHPRVRERVLATSEVIFAA